MKPRRQLLGLATLIVTSAPWTGQLNAQTFNFTRGVSNTFGWNNNPAFGDGTNNWGTSPVGGFPNAAGVTANLTNNTTAAQTINLGQDITVGQLVFGNGASSNTRTVQSGGAGSFVLTMNHNAGDSLISQTSSSTGNVTAAVGIAGNGVLTLSNTSTGQLNISGGITSLLASGTQTVNKAGSGGVTVNSVIGNGSAGGTVAVGVSAGTLTLNAANSFTGATTISGGILALGGTAGSLSTSSAITNNAVLSIARTNAVVQGTDFSGSAISGTGEVRAIGTGLNLTLNTANTYQGNTTIGASANNSVVRATASGALGSGTIQFDTTGNASAARFEVSGGISLSNVINLPGRTNSTVAIQNISGDNTLSGNINLGTGGNNYTVDSAAGLLAITGNITPPGSGDRGIFFTGAGDTQVGGDILFTTGNNLSVTKQGSGTLTLSGNSNTYTGATIVSAGTLLVNGSLANTAVSVSAGTLGGSGSVVGTVSVNGILSPGNSIESLATGSLTMASGSSYVFEAADNSSTGADLVAVSGTLSLTDVTLDFDAATLAAFASGSWDFDDKITLISYTGAGINSGFTGYTDDTSYFFGANEWLFNYNDTAAGNNFLTDATANGQDQFVTITLIPEPGAALLGGLGWLALLRRRR